MTTKNKVFDCVEMKRQCQKKMQDEYESRKSEFKDYFDFLKKRANESSWIKKIHKETD